MTDGSKEDVFLELNKLREILNSLLQPEVLDKLVSLQEELGGDNHDCMLNRYEWLLDYGKKGPDCTYIKAAKDIFLQENGDNAVELIRWLYNNWAKEL